MFSLRTCFRVLKLIKIVQRDNDWILSLGYYSLIDEKYLSFYNF